MKTFAGWTIQNNFNIWTDLTFGLEIYKVACQSKIYNLQNRMR